MRARGSFFFFALIASALILSGGMAEAARISEVMESGTLEKVARFFSFQDPSLRYALVGTMLLGLCCGVMGGFLVVRKLSLMGDALAHAVLPGIALGFLWNMTKDPLAIFVGATIVGLLGAATVQWIRTKTKHKEDAALGFVLASFFGVGICLFTMIQNLPGGAKTGLDKYLFGQAAAMGMEDVGLLAVVSVLICGGVFVFFKEFRLASFDPGFARSIGMRVQIFHYSLMLLLAFAIVSSLQAVGVVLVSAMLVIPAATGILLTNRFGLLLCLSAGIGVFAGATGAFFSFIGKNLPTGPFMVLAAAAVFCVAFFLAPGSGVLSKWWRQRCRASRIERENTLKSMFHVLERGGFVGEKVREEDLASLRGESREEIHSKLRALCHGGLATMEGGNAMFTPEGKKRAGEIVRNHRLWELYLTNAAHIPADHVHDDAENIEHILDPETVRKLEKRLNYASRDPHGREIPRPEEIYSASRQKTPRIATGFGREENHDR